MEILSQAKALAQRYRALTRQPLGITGEVAEFEAARRIMRIRPLCQRRVVTGMTKRSAQQVALRRRPARIGWICRLTGATKVLQYPLDSGKRSDAEHAKTRFRRCPQVSDRCRSTADGSLDSTALPAAAERVLGTTRALSGLAGANTP
jgi:hypothetical protein